MNQSRLQPKVYKLQTRNGFTLLEILIATGIFMTVIIFAVAIFTNTAGSASTSEQYRATTQSARFIFESISREMRLSRGLVTVQDDKQFLLVPPFELKPVTPDGPQIIVYRVKNAGLNESGTTLYQITRKIYKGKKAGEKIFVVVPQKTHKALLTIQEVIDNKITNDEVYTWQPINPAPDQQELNVLPSDLVLDNFEILNYRNYPKAYDKDNPNDPESDINTQLVVQPFIQLQLSIMNPRYNVRGSGEQVRSTLRTMIVPRDFITRYEVIPANVTGN